MIYTTDVPDWCMWEGAGQYFSGDFKQINSVDLLIQLREKSPIKYIDNVLDLI